MLANRAAIKVKTPILKTPHELCIMALDWAIAHLFNSYQRLDWSDERGLPVSAGTNAPVS